jgi:hypothetical protein
MLELLFLFVRGFLFGFRSRRDLALENLVLRHQLQVALRTNPAPRLSRRDRALWVWIDRLWPHGNRDQACGEGHVGEPRLSTLSAPDGRRQYPDEGDKARRARPTLRCDVRSRISNTCSASPAPAPCQSQRHVEDSARRRQLPRKSFAHHAGRHKARLLSIITA